MSKIPGNFFIAVFTVFLAGQTLLSVQSHAFSDGSAQGKKVLVVASYYPGYKWQDEIIRSLEHNLGGAELTFFYMDTKKNLDGAEQKAGEAYKLYLAMQPDAVITVDDNAQAYFVVPYLKDKVKTPVVFCGVNDDASKYGFPASNVTGVLEKKHYRESISFAQLMKPEISRVAILYRASPSNLVNLAQIDKEKEQYTAEIVTRVEVKTMADVIHAAADLEGKADAAILLNMSGITGDGNKQVEGHKAIKVFVEKSRLVTIGASNWEVEAGTLCGVIKSGEEQGSLAADLLLAHWGGRKINELGLTQNKNGQRYLNLSTLKRLNIPLKPTMIIGTTIVPGN